MLWDLHPDDCRIYERAWFSPWMSLKISDVKQWEIKCGFCRRPTRSKGFWRVSSDLYRIKVNGRSLISHLHRDLCWNCLVMAVKLCEIQDLEKLQEVLKERIYERHSRDQKKNARIMEELRGWSSYGWWSENTYCVCAHCSWKSQGRNSGSTFIRG